MPGTNRKMAKKKQAPVKKMRGGAMMAKPKAAPMKKGGAAKKKTTAKVIPRADNPGFLPKKAPSVSPGTSGGFLKKSPPKLKDLPLRKKDGGAVKKMRGGGMAAKPKAAPMKKGGGVTKSRVRSSSKKAL